MDGRTPGPFERLLRIEAASGLLLLIGTVAALLCANSPLAEHYEQLWETRLPGTNVSLHFLINDGLMTIFFLVVGLEIRREIHDGALSGARAATLPLAAALGGIAAPALLFIAINWNSPAHQGWAIPTATDIAFAVGVLTLLGRRIHPSLRALLLTLAIADDIAAVLIIAFFYADGIALTGVAVSTAAAMSTAALHRFGVRLVLPYFCCGIALWYGLLEAGIHPALAGVVLGLLTPISNRHACGPPERTPLAHRLEKILHPWVAFAIMPLFAFANAGMNVSGIDTESATSIGLAAGVVLGLVVGKPLGIVGAAALAVRAGICTLPRGVTWGGLGLIGCLGGIGFTMSLFISALAFPDPLPLSAAKLAVLIGSAIAGTIGLVVGTLVCPIVKGDGLNDQVPFHGEQK
jgi:Na+:H+ antiporter, NhaA family